MAGLVDNTYLGVGIYSVPEAARLTGVSARRIRRWLSSYTFTSAGRARASAPVWPGQLPIIDGTLALGFRDLIEIRFVDAFLERGVTWKTIRKAAERGRSIFQTTHPISSKRFVTDGRSLFAEMLSETGERALMDVVKNQWAFRQIIAPYFKGLDFEGAQTPARWWPMGSKGRVKGRVVVDPQRSFGQPIVAREGVPTRILAKAYRVEGDLDNVARWYNVEPASVRAAVNFEQQLAA